MLERMECWIRDSRLTGLLSKNSSGGVIPFDSSHLSSLLGLLLLRRIENLETPKTVYILTLRTSKELRLFDGSIIRGTPPWSRLETLSPHPPFFHLLLLSYPFLISSNHGTLIILIFIKIILFLFQFKHFSLEL